MDFVARGRLRWILFPLAIALSLSVNPAHAAWTTYHRDLSRSGLDPTQPPFASVDPSWVSDVLDGEVYAQPLVLNGRVLIATEGDSVYALDALTGAIAWRTNLGTPVPLSELPCGNIDPVGITSTPVIDPAASLLYTVAFLQPAHHELVALELSTGSVRWRRAIDAPGTDPRVHNQRGALALSSGRVYVPYGGRLGDCGNYHGWVVAGNVSGTGDLLSYQVPTSREGGIWAPSGIAADAGGSLYVATGNGESTTDFDHGNSVIRLSPQLAELDFFAPINWAELSAADLDLGSVGPALLDDGLVLQIGKEGVGYLLQQDMLGGIGGESFSAQVCASAFGGTAHTASMIYVPCTNGLVALELGAGPAFSLAWASASFFAGPPIISGNAVWTISRTGVLFAMDALTGDVVFQTALACVTHFATPASDGGRVFAPAGRQIAAFVLTP